MTDAKAIRLKTFYGFDVNGHCGSVQAKTRRTAERLLRERITDGRALTIEVSPHNCPGCGGDNFGVGDGFPVTAGGWHGGLCFDWGRYAGVHTVRCTGKRCADCGHEVSINPKWDN